MERASELAKLTSPYMMRRENDVLSAYLPPKREFTVFCTMSDLQIKMYEKVISMTLPKIHTGSLLQGTILAILVLLGKLATHPWLAFCRDIDSTFSIGDKENTSQTLDKFKTPLVEMWKASNARDELRLEDSGKMSILFSILKEIIHRNEKVVVGSGSTETLNLVQRLCDSENWPTVRLDGSIDSLKRDSAVRTFNNVNSAMIFLLSKRAGGVGLTLTGGKHLITIDVDWNPAVDAQTYGRIYREGQKQETFIYKLVSS